MATCCDHSLVIGVGLIRVWALEHSVYGSLCTVHFCIRSRFNSLHEESSPNHIVHVAALALPQGLTKVLVFGRRNIRKVSVYVQTALMIIGELP